MRPARAQHGFTLLELVVGMGLLAILLAMLVQILATGVDIFGKGERGQALADRTQTAARAVRGAFERTVGPARLGRIEACDPTARLLVYPAPLGLQPSATMPRVQVVRSTIALDEATESRLLTARLRDVAAAEVGTQNQAELDKRVRELVARWPRRGVGELLLVAWPQDPKGVFLELREGVWPSDPELVPEHVTPLPLIADEKELDLDPDVVQRNTRAVATGLLHVEFQFWTQLTTAWGNSGRDGPVRVWDSARAGLLVGKDDGTDAVGDEFGGGFPFDLFPKSLRDPRDDVWPRWVRIVMTVGYGSESPPEALVVGNFGPSDKELTVNRVDRLPDPRQNPWIKVDAEWIRVQTVAGRRLGGLQRGQRGTKAVAHGPGTAVRAGREVELIVRIEHGRDADV